jgi:glycosyltransferase involved in cell wall biosynthesis
VRVLLTCHHHLRADAGAPGALLALRTALEDRGCEVDCFSFDQAYGELREERVGHQLRFPWHVGAFLARRAHDFDVVDAFTGDAWVWGSLGRPRAAGTALVTRSHGLEHIAAQQLRRAARAGVERLSWKYPLYRAGLRLWEVRRSLRLSDRCILLNGAERDYVRDRLGVPEQQLSVLPNGIAARFLEAPVAEAPKGGPLRLAHVGSWTPRKGRHVLVEAARSLDERGVDFSLSLFGSGDEAAVLGSFPERLRPRLAVTSSFANEDLPGLLAGHELFLFPSLFEGASVALLEAMACGLAPVATAVGSAPALVLDGEHGALVAPGSAPEVADAVERLARDRARLLEMRRGAQDAARRYSWENVAARTVRVYESAVAARSTASTKRGAIRSQV